MDYRSHHFAEAVRRLAATLRELTERGLPLAVLGAGEHTRRVLERLDLSAWTDRLYDHLDEGEESEPLALPVSPLSELDLQGSAHFVLCTHFQQENLREWLLTRGVEAERIHDMYTPADRVRQFVRVAYDPLADLRIPPTPGDAPGPGVARSRSGSRFVNRVLLVHPPFARANRRHKKTMPMGLLALGGWLRKRFPDIQVELVDAHITDTAPAEVIAHILGRHYDLVCLTAWTAQAPMAFAIADAVRAKGEAYVVIGGVHATLCPDETLEHADFIVAGEGELPLGDLVEALREGGDPSGIDGVGVAKGQDPGRQMIKDLDILPYPAWELLPDWRLYNYPLHVVGGYRFPLMGSRGCPFACTFCSSPLMWNRRVRWNSPEYVAGQMFAAHRRYAVNQFHFWDDNLLLKPGHMDRVCELVLESGVEFRWLGLSRASDINRRKELLPLMKRAGCVGMEIGIESFTQQSADLTHKGEEIDAMAQAAENLMRAGLAPLYTHMLFTPGEDLASYPAKKRFLERINSKVPEHLRSDGGLGQLTTPHRGTEFAAEALTMGTVMSRENAHYVHHRVNFLPDSLLDDTPRRLTATSGSPYPHLHLIAGYVHDWTLEDMERYVLAHAFLWDAMDGKRTIRQLADMVARHQPWLSRDRAMVFTALVMVGLAKDNRITGERNDIRSALQDSAGQRFVA
ncbi:B12-binding domain-containing radical SAM protein [Fundidesulfovibrio butyratiphilus]